MIDNTFSNVGHDEDGNPIGNCTMCGAVGVLIPAHDCKGEDEYYNELYLQHEQRNFHRFLIEHNHMETEIEKTWK